MNLYQHPKCLADNLDLMLTHDVFLMFYDPENGPCAYGPAVENTHILCDALSNHGVQIYGPSNIVDTEPFYMCFDAWFSYKKYIEELREL